MIIALIGMTGVGKTSIGQMLARALGLDFLDTDELVREAAQKSPAEIFEQSGDGAFRDLESAALAAACLRDNIILACGGGIVLREQNRELLRRRARVIWLTRPPEHVLKDARVLSRPPIGGSPGRYAELLKARASLYARTCHLIIDLSRFSFT